MWCEVSGALLLLALVLVAYLPAMDGEFLWDDVFNVERNPFLRGTQGLVRIWLEPATLAATTFHYYPLTTTTFWLDCQLWGLYPRGYHLVNALLHGLVAICFWRLLRQLTLPAAWFAAAVFALHPIHVESVAWISERKNPLSALLCLLAIRSALSGPSVRHGILAWTWFALALLAKPTSVTLPVVLLLLWWWRRDRLLRQDWFLVGTMSLTACGFGALTVWLEQSVAHAGGDEMMFPPLVSCVVASRAIWFYVGKLLWPWPLMFIYPRGSTEPILLRHLVAVVALVAVVVWLWVQRARYGKGPVVAALAAVVNVLPTAGYVPFAWLRFSLVADHLAYFPSLSLIPLLVIAARRLAQGAPSSLRRAGAFVVLGAFFLLTWQRARVFVDGETLARDTIARNPVAAAAHYNLGTALAAKGDLSGAIASFRRALLIDSSDTAARYNLANTLLRSGDIAAAIAEYRALLAVAPDHRLAWNNLGVALSQSGDPESALDAFAHVSALGPDDAQTHYNRANALLALGRTEEAVAAYEQALVLEPAFADAHRNLAHALRRLGRTREADAHWHTLLLLEGSRPP